ncbi:MAG: hypothetical protein LC121_06820 [Anaerolineae bacterium]|nr:hypothetical protein [Anaerolineae bacterium]
MRIISYSTLRSGNQVISASNSPRGDAPSSTCTAAAIRRAARSFVLHLHGFQISSG